MSSHGSERIEEIMRRVKAASPGPWSAHDNHGARYVSNGKDGPFAKFDNRICEAAMNYFHPPVIENMDFIAHAREDIPYLLGEIEKRDEALKAAQKTLQIIAKPRSFETDGSESAEEFEELYDFWHMASAEKLNAAVDCLARIAEIMSGVKA